MRATFLIALIVAAGLALAAAPALAEKRVALVVGNQTYANAPSLTNPRNDASDVAAALRRLGFDVTEANDLTYAALRTGLKDFRAKAAGADVATIYYAGHGIEIDQRNYIVPVDATLGSDGDIEFEAVPLDLVVSTLTGVAGLRLVIVDACRDNPFAARMQRSGATRSIGRGLARVEPSGETLIAYAAKEGTTAQDGDGRNSPYAAALLGHLEEPGLEIGLMFRKVRDTVLAATAGQQEPFVYGSLSSRAFYLKAKLGGKVPDTGGGLPVPGGRDNAASFELAFWNSVKDSGDAEVLKTYLKAFPNGTFAGLAELMVKRLEVASVDPVRKDDDTSAGARIAGRNLTLSMKLGRTTIEGKERASMGVEIATLDPRMARGVGLPGVGGTMIVAVGGGSAAERAGLRAGDVLVKYDGKPVGEMAELPKLVAASAIGDDVTAEVWRVGQGLGDLLEALERRALNGDDDAAWTLFDIHRRKFGGVEDLGERIKWARRAATDGDMSAQFDMAVAHRDGTGVAKNPGEALSWARKAAEQGHAEAQWTVGSAYRNGIGVAKNLNEAFGWELKAAGQGIAIAQAMVGFAYEVGSGTERNTFEALGWYRKSAAQGNHYSEYKIGQFHAQGSGGVTVDNAEAEKWFRKAADAGFADAQHALANFYFDGTGGLAKNRSTAAGLYRKAADQGNALAQNMLGWLYENGEGVTRDPAEAERWWLKAAEAGNHDGQFWLGWAYSTSTVENTGFQRDDRKAAEYFRKAANQNHTMAMFNLAIAYDQGKGLAKDPREAGSLLVQSIKKGNDHAVTQLKTNSAGWSVELRREMQRLLQQAGHYSGAIDGQFGPGTSRALDALAKKG